MSKQQQIQEVIASLREAVADISGAVVASPDGLVLASDLGESEAPRAGAMAATGSGLGRRIAETLAVGSVEEVMVKGDNGYVLVYRAGDKSVLGVVAKGRANLGLVNLEARAAAEKLEKILG